MADVTVDLGKWGMVTVFKDRAKEVSDNKSANMLSVAGGLAPMISNYIGQEASTTARNVAAGTVGLPGDMQTMRNALTAAPRGKPTLPTSDELVEEYGGDREHWSYWPAMIAAPGPGEIAAVGKGMLAAAPFAAKLGKIPKNALTQDQQFAEKVLAHDPQAGGRAMVGDNALRPGQQDLFGKTAAQETAQNALNDKGISPEKFRNIDEYDQNLAEVRLYNAGYAAQDPNGYIDPHVSDWVNEVASGAGDVPVDEITAPLVYMSADPDWVDTIVSRKVGKNVGDVTVDDIRQHGRLNILDVDPDDIYEVGEYGSQNELLNMRGEGLRFYESNIYDEGDVYTGQGRLTELPFGPETGDFITNQSVKIKQSLTGDALIEYLRSIGKLK